MSEVSKINGSNLKDATARADIAGLKDGSIVAGKATNDGNGNAITGYIRSLSVSGKTITYTLGNGTTGTLTTQDTDTHYTSYLYVGSSTGASNAATTNGNTYLKLAENGTVRSARKIIGTGFTTVTSDSSGNISINTPQPSDWTFATVTSNYWKSSSSTATKGTITVYMNPKLKLCYLAGNIVCNNTSSSDWDIIPYSRLVALLGVSAVNSNISGSSIIGACSYYNGSTFEGEKNGYGGYVSFNSGKTALRFGRVYTSTGSRGDWEFSNLINIGIHFTAMFALA